MRKTAPEPKDSIQKLLASKYDLARINTPESMLIEQLLNKPVCLVQVINDPKWRRQQRLEDLPRLELQQERAVQIAADLAMALWRRGQPAALMHHSD
jgi:hypothetical protein